MKKVFLPVLCLLLTLVSFPGPAEMPGETAEVFFRVTSDISDISLLRIKLTYDTEALEQVSIAGREGVLSRIVGPGEETGGFDFAAVFRIRENAQPGEYPVKVRVVEALYNGNAEIPEQLYPIYSEAAITVKHPPAEVPVYYLSGDGTVVAVDSVTLDAGRTAQVKAKAPEGWAVVGGQSISVTVTEDGQAMPSSVTFWLTMPTSAPLALPEITVDITAEFGSNTLKWNRVPGAERYQVHRGTSVGIYDTTVVVAGDSYTDTAVKAGTTYYYMVEAVFPNGQIVTAQKNIVSVTATPAPTALPKISLGITREIGSNTLKWNSVPGAVGYRVYRSTSGYANYTLLDTVSGLTYTDTAVKAGKTYYYKVEAVFPNGQIVYDQKSITAATATPSPTPTPTLKPTPLPRISLEITRKIGKNTLTWNRAPGAARYQIYRSVYNSSNYVLLATVPGISYTDSSVKAGTTYYYKVEAVFPNGNRDAQSDACPDAEADAAAGNQHVYHEQKRPQYAELEPCLRRGAISGLPRYVRQRKLYPA